MHRGTLCFSCDDAVFIPACCGVAQGSRIAMEPIVFNDSSVCREMESSRELKNVDESHSFFCCDASHSVYRT